MAEPPTESPTTPRSSPQTSGPRALVAILLGLFFAAVGAVWGFFGAGATAYMGAVSCGDVRAYDSCPEIATGVVASLVGAAALVVADSMAADCFALKRSGGIGRVSIWLAIVLFASAGATFASWVSPSYRAWNQSPQWWFVLVLAAAIGLVIAATVWLIRTFPRDQQG